jgi:EmrB/QacA subfamily drug resistance transporter
VNIALPSAQADLDFSNADRQWVVTAYALAFGSLLLLGGRLCDLYGRKRVFLFGVGGFAAASALGGAANSFEMLVFARGLQGLFGALLAPAALSLLATTFRDPAERAKAFAVYGAIAGAGGGVGLLLGGLLTEYLNWRWCLFVNLFFAAIALFGGVVLLVGGRENQRVKLDLLGTGVSVAGLFAIVYGFSRAETEGWSDVGTLASLIGGAVLLAAFVRIENVVESPLLPMRVILDRARGGSYIALFVSSAGLFGVSLFLTYYMQGSLGYSPVQCGLGFLPFIAAASVFSGLTMTKILPRVGPLWTVAGGEFITIIGLVALTRIDTDTAYASLLLPCLMVIGGGAGMAFATGYDLGTRGVASFDAGIASSLVNVTQQVGGSVATAFLNTMAASALSGYLADHGTGADALAQGTVHSYVVAFWWSIGIFAVGVAISIYLFRGLRPSAGEPVPDDAAGSSAFAQTGPLPVAAD